MDKEQLAKLKYCPYCFLDMGTIEQEFEIAYRTWRYYDAETGEEHSNMSKDDDVIVFCTKCENEILEGNK